MLDPDLFKPVADEIARRRDVMLIGYAGGGIRNIFSNKPASQPWPSCRACKVRVQGAPIWSRTFAAIGMSPTVIAYNEIYNAIQNNVIEAGENEAAGVEQMRFFEVAPNLAHDAARHHHPADLLLGQTFKRLPRGSAGGVLQRRQAKPAPTAAQIESSEDTPSSTPWRRPGKLQAGGVHGARRDEARRRPGDGRLRQGNRRRTRS